MANYLTTLVKTDPDAGVFGLSMILIDTAAAGVKVRKMETQFDSAHSTTFITLDDVKVPVGNLIGAENQGFMHIVTNLNHERLVIAVSALRSSRTCYEQALGWVMDRQVFGKRLVEHQVVQFKLAEMAARLESLQDAVEKVAYQFKCGVPDHKLGTTCALLKVQAGRTFEFCAREASQLLGGASIVKEGRGKKVERLYREVRTIAIPGGSEEVLLANAGKDIYKKSKKLKASQAQAQSSSLQAQSSQAQSSQAHAQAKL